MAKHAHYDAATGRTLGIYDSDLHRSIPEPNVPINDAEWQALMDEPSLHRIDPASRKVVRVAVPISTLAARCIMALQQARDAALAAGFAYTMPGGVADVVQIRDRDAASLAALLSRARSAGPDAVIPFRAASNRVYELSAGEMVEIADAALAAREAILMRFWSRKDDAMAAQAANDRAAIDAVTWA